MVEIAILKFGIQNELRLNPHPVEAFADDIVLSLYDTEVLHSMLRASEPIMLGAGVELSHRSLLSSMIIDLEATGTKV